MQSRNGSAPLAPRFERVLAARSQLVKRWRFLRHRAKRSMELGWSAGLRGLRFDDLRDDEAVLMTFSMLLRRDPDPVGRADYLQRMEAGHLTRGGMIQSIIASTEFRLSVPVEDLVASMHSSRCQFVRSLPRAQVILDLGGTDLGDQRGALVSMGYPYRFERVIVVDLPSSDRHDLYRASEWEKASSHLGPVEYYYHSMVELDSIPDRSVDLVYSGQSIEHITRDEAKIMLDHVRRILKKNGRFALDTPNGPVWRRRYPDALINPDHKVEYSHQEMTEMLSAAGFAVDEAKGLNYLGASLAAGGFDEAEAAQNVGVFDEIEHCLNLAYLCRPAP
jgi:predicted SAM-dependent methyltransferase